MMGEGQNHIKLSDAIRKVVSRKNIRVAFYFSSVFCPPRRMNSNFLISFPNAKRPTPSAQLLIKTDSVHHG
jgi:hypothetical protein